MNQRADMRSYRDELKGIAILWVIFFHARLGLESTPVYALQQVGYLGVDMLLFLSGFGLYHSLNRQQTLRQYLSRRARRLLPGFLPICLLWCIFMIPRLNLSPVESIRTAAGNLTMLNFLASVPAEINWYLSMILVTLLLAPFLHSLLSTAKKPMATWALLVLGSCAVGLCYIAHDHLMLVSRLPIFVLGMGFAMPKGTKERPKTAFILYLLGFVVGAAMLWLCFIRYPDFLLDYGMYWYPGLLMVPPICAAIGFLLRKTSGVSGLFAPLRLIGRASFEIFLFNTWFEVYCKKVAQMTAPLDYLLWMLLSLAAGILWHLAISWVYSKFFSTEREG